MKHVTDELVATGEYKIPFDKSPRRRWFGPLAITLFGLLFVAVRYFFVDASLKTNGILLLYVISSFGLIAYAGSYYAPYGEPAPTWLVTAKIFGLPFIFLGFIFLLGYL